MRRLTLIAGLLVAAPALAAVQDGQTPRLQAEYRDETARARRLRDEADVAAREIADLERQLAGLRGEDVRDDAEVTAQRARLRELGAREAALTAELSQVRGRHLRLLSALQMMSRRPPPPLLVSADRAVDTVRAAILMRAVAPELQRRAQGIVDRQSEVARVRRLAALGSERLFTLESAQGDRRARIESLIARQTALKASASAEAGEAERAASALETRLRALNAAVPAPSTETPASSPRPAGRSRLSAPAPGRPSARFGGGSSGWRWSADRTQASAPASGRVAYAGPLSGWGQVVILDLGPGWRAVVAGLDQLSVGDGQRVTDGQALGRSGPDGQIYFELRRDERPVDPAPWLE